jgi:structural maintenance of chromosome 4
LLFALLSFTKVFIWLPYKFKGIVIKCILFYFQAVIAASAANVFKTVIINTCVCQASRIAYGAPKEFRRVVTLVGEVFEKSGTMSGGGKKAQRGMMGTAIQESISEDAIKKAENELNNLVDKLNLLREKMNDAKKHYRSMEEAKSRLEMELAKAKKEVCKRAVFCLP